MPDPTPTPDTAAPQMGRCGHKAPHLYPGWGVPQQFCRLPAGHTGWHAGDDEAEWSQPEAGSGSAALTDDESFADDYRDLADAIIGAFNPPDDDVAEYAIVVRAVQRAAEFVTAQPCECAPDVTDPNVLAMPCRRCRVLGRRGDQLEER